MYKPLSMNKDALGCINCTTESRDLACLAITTHTGHLLSTNGSIHTINGSVPRTCGAVQTLARGGHTTRTNKTFEEYSWG